MAEQSNAVRSVDGTKKEQEHFTEEFKELITSMLASEPCFRIGMADIIGHPWMQGPIATEDEIREEFKVRVRKLKIEPNVKGD